MKKQHISEFMTGPHLENDWFYVICVQLGSANDMRVKDVKLDLISATDTLLQLTEKAAIIIGNK